jgi:hypothetical protein
MEKCFNLSYKTGFAVGMVWSPTKDVRREVAKEDLGMDTTWKKEKRTITKDLVQ